MSSKIKTYVVAHIHKDETISFIDRDLNIMITKSCCFTSLKVAQEIAFSANEKYRNSRLIDWDFKVYELMLKPTDEQIVAQEGNQRNQRIIML